MSDELVSLPQIRDELGLDRATVLWLRKRLWREAIEQKGSKPYLYPRPAVEAALKHRVASKAVRGTAFGVGKFPPSSDLVFCPCGRAFIDDTYLALHIDRDHAGVIPAQTDTPPVYRYSMDEIAAEAAAQPRPGEHWRKTYPAKQLDAASV